MTDDHSTAPITSWASPMYGGTPPGVMTVFGRGNATKVEPPDVNPTKEAFTGKFAKAVAKRKKRNG